MGNSVQDLRRQKWVKGAAIQIAVSYWDGADWQGTNANVDIISRDGDMAIGVIASTGASTTGRFDGQQVTIDVPNGRAKIEVS